MQKSRNAFTLVELAIVLVVLGLLTGGIIAGQSLLRSAQIRDVTADIARYIQATNSFRTEFRNLPGDMPNATSYWGAQDATPATCRVTASTGEATCNGNGDGIISAYAAGSNELFRFWQHLANAGLISGSYNGVAGGALAYEATLANAPAGKIPGTIFSFFSWGSATPAASFFTVPTLYNNTLIFGTMNAASWPSFAALWPEEAASIDKKTDDGWPGMGKIVAYPVSTCTLAGSSADTTAAYRLTTKSNACVLMLPNAFN